MVNHPNAVVLPPPLNVSPFIRFCRWSALLGGIAYGMYRKGAITRKHQVIREAEHKLEVEQQNKLTKERNMMNREELLSLAQVAGLTVNEELEKQLGIVKSDGH